MVVARSVVAETECQHGVPTERVLQELAVALGAQVISPVMTRITAVILGIRVGDSFQHLMQLCQMIDVVVDFVFTTVIRCSLDVDLHDVAGLVGGIDLALTTIANVVDHHSCLTVSMSHDAVSTLLAKIRFKEKSS
jgi:hypothetical protein